MEYNRAYFKDQVCAVTGGASGIGLALCEELLESGAKRVVLVDFNKENLAAHEKRLSAQYPGRVKGVLCNVTIEDDVRHMVKEAAAFGDGRLDLLINCAGAAFAGVFIDVSPDGASESVVKAQSNESWQKAFALNFYGALYGCREALPIMTAQHSGQIVNIISGIAFMPMAYQSMYAATKAALCALTLALRYEFWDEGVKFNTATPGTTATPIFTSTGGQAPPEAQSPHQSAQRILHGVSNNARLIMGDDGDVSGGKNCFLPDDGGRMVDGILNGFARQRRSGQLSFVAQSEAFAPGDPQLWEALGQILNAPIEQAFEKAAAYCAMRQPLNLNEGYYEGKTAAVTCGAKGVGLALCEKLLECGAKKVVLADSDPASLEKQQKRLNEKYPGKVKAILCEIGDEASVQNMIAQAQTFFEGSFDLLINCADAAPCGMFAAPADPQAGRHIDLDITSSEEWARIFRVNFYGPLYACRAALPIMLGQGDGQIVNLISSAAFTPMAYRSAYACTKAALNMLTLALRYEYGDLGVKFNCASSSSAGAGGPEAPESAEATAKAAVRILTGVAKNDRITSGCDDELQSAMFTYNLDAAPLFDDRSLKLARQRRGGGSQ